MISENYSEMYNRQFHLINKSPLFDIEASSACNEACFFCPRSVMRRRAKHMTEETMELLLDWLPSNATVMFSGLGESILNPFLPEFVEGLKERGIGSCLITNGVLLDTPRVEKLIDAGIQEIQVSLHSLDEDEYQNVTVRGGNLPQVIENLHKLTERYSGKIRLNIVNVGQDSRMLESLSTFASEIGAEYFERQLHNRGGTIKTKHVSLQDKRLCGIHAAVTLITSDGDILSCVNDASGDSTPGNIRDMSWTDTMAWKIRNLESGLTNFDQCSGCNDEYRWTILEQGSVDHR
jgi:MoaA/NifB/PqqE/SkfB family radical SAM enzyme